MARFAFAFYATQWRPDLTWPLEVCLHSLDTNGGAAAGADRYLVYSETITPEIRAFCERHRLTVQYERRLTYRQAFPNKALMCRVPQHDAVCLTDVDVVFLADPTPLLEQVAASRAVHARLDVMLPLWPWPSMPPRLQRYLRDRVGNHLWRAQYERFSQAQARPVTEVPRPGGGTMPPYFQGGVLFLPGCHQRELGDAWWHVCSRLLRDHRLRRPYTRFFTPYFLEQMSFALALHREAIPYRVLPSTHNFIPSMSAPADDLAILPGSGVVMAHIVSPIRDWLAPGKEVNCPAPLLPLFKRVRALAEEARSAARMAS